MLALAVEVGDLGEVAENVVSVEAHQRVGVDHHGREAGHDDQIVTNIIERSRSRGRPDQGGQTRDEALNVHAGRRGVDSLPLRSEPPRRSDVDVGDRREQNQ